MIAMQYSFTLPADYDMSVIDRRIADKGPLLDGFPGLKFKAYLVARRGEHGPENLYAPFYVWNEDEGLAEFLCGPGFAGVTQSFGWPQVRTWICWRVEASKDIGEAAYATRELLTTPAHAPLADIRKRESDDTTRDVESGAVASVAGFDPTHWTRVRFRLWRERPAEHGEAQLFRVGHMSLSQVQ